MDGQMKKFAAILTTVLLVSGSLIAQTFNDASQWKAFDDAAKGGTSKITKTESMETIDGKEALAITITGAVTTKYQYGFIGVAADPSPETLTFMKTAKGITFKTVGDGHQYRVKIETSDIADFDMYGKTFTAPKDKAGTVTVPYSALAQEGWGAKKKFDPAKITKISFQTVGQPVSSVSVKIIGLESY